jgi:predicted  nucleic acid-binding Zn-ribbon protein
MDDHKVAVLMEQLMSQFRTFGEGLDMLNEKFDREFTEVKTNIRLLKNEVTDLRVEIGEQRQEINGLKQDVIVLKQDVRDLKQDMGDLKFQNKQEHQMLMQAIKETDTEVQKLKRIK